MSIKKIKSILIFITMFIVIRGSNSYAQPSAIKVFNNIAARLAHLKVIKYRYTREFNYPSNAYIAKSDGDIYISFAEEYDVTGFRYLFHYKDGFSFFNNAELVNINTLKKTMNVKSKVKPANMEGNSALFNSIITLRNALPGIIADKSILKVVTDTVVNGKIYYMLQFNLQDKLINYLGTGFSKTTVDITFNYKIIVDKNSDLPITVLQTKKGSLDLNRTDFINIDTKPAPPADGTWYYSSYLKDYRIEDAQTPVHIIKIGEMAPDWQLTNFGNNAKANLAQYKGTTVLLEFWIKNCGYCIEAVPGLNQISKDFRDKDFNLLAINTEDSQKSIGQFISLHDVKYSVLYGDKTEVNKAYGIQAFPEVVLIDKTGIVIYSGEFDHLLVEKLVNENL